MRDDPRAFDGGESTVVPPQLKMVFEAFMSVYEHRR